MRTPAALFTLTALLSLLGATAPASAQDTGFGTFLDQVEVRVVNVDVVVTDRRGQPVLGLTQDDFEVFEDGKPVEITYFTAVSEGFEWLAEAAGKEPEARGARARAATWVVYVDQLGMRPAERNQALREVRAFLETALERGDPVAVATFDGQAFRVLQAATTEHRRALDALTTLERSRASHASALSESMLVREAQVADPADLHFVDVGMSLADQINVLIDTEADRVQHAIQSMGHLVDLFGTTEGRLALLYVGNGIQTLPGITATEIWRQRFAGVIPDQHAPQPENRRVELQRNLDEIYARLSATRASVYAIEGAGASGASLVSADDTGSVLIDDPVVGDTSRFGQTASMRELAARTGGLHFRANPRLGDQLSAARLDQQHYYSLAYTPQRPLDGRYHRISVKVKQDGLRLRHREAIRERTPGERVLDAVVYALYSDQQSNSLQVQVETGTMERASRRRQALLPVTVHIPVRALTLLPDGNVHRGRVGFHFAVAGEDGAISRFEPSGLPLEIPNAELAGALRQSISYQIDLALAAGTNRLAVAVHDELANTRSIVSVPVAATARR